MQDSSTIKVSIPTVTEVGSYSLYDLEIAVKLNQFKIVRYRVSKRYSDFLQLKNELEEKNLELPDLPSKYSSFYKRNETLINERKTGLKEFSNIILNNPILRAEPIILNFFGIPKSTIIEVNMLNGESTHTKSAKITSVVNIESAQQWMEVYKNVKSLLQDSRAKMFSKGNIIEIRKNLKILESDIELLKKYLNDTQEIGMGEIRRRKDLLDSLIKELTDLNTTLYSMNFNTSPSSSSRPQSSVSLNSNSSNGTNELFKTTGSRRTFGKVKETHETKKLDNLGLFQMQKQEMKNQDQNIDALKEIIMRQKQIGVAVNEELSIQNELLDNLNQEVDQSTAKMRVAKNRVNKIL